MPRSATEAPTVEPQAQLDATIRQEGLGVLLVLGGLIGLVAAVVLLVEKIALIRNPEYIPSCSINPVLSCGSIMKTWQAEAFGIPNPILGVAGFAAVTMVGAGILAGARFANWFWIGLQVGVTFAVVFVHWLIYQSLYVIGALCPYCMVVWAVTIPLCWYVTLRNLRSPHHANRGIPGRLVTVLNGYRSTILAAWFLVIVGLIAHRFWYFWSTLV